MTIRLSDAALFDEIVHRGIDSHGCLPQASMPILVSKEAALSSGRAGCVIAFDVQLPDGSIRTAQCTITVRLLLQAAAALHARHESDVGDRSKH